MMKDGGMLLPPNGAWRCSASLKHVLPYESICVCIWTCVFSWLSIYVYTCNPKHVYVYMHAVSALRIPVQHD